MPSPLHLPGLRRRRARSPRRRGAYIGGAHRRRPSPQLLRPDKPAKRNPGPAAVLDVGDDEGLCQLLRRGIGQRGIKCRLHRAWVTRNFKGLQDEINLVVVHVQDKPAWYKEKVYPKGTVPSLEQNNEIKGESLDLIKYIDSNFSDPVLLPEDLVKREIADKLIAFADTFTKALYSPLMSHVEMSEESVAALDKIEAALSKFSAPFLLGQFSLVDIAYVTILERVQIYYSHVRSYDITKGRPSLEKFIEEMNKIEAK